MSEITLTSPQYKETIWPTMGLLRGFADWHVRWDAVARPDPAPDFVLDVGGGVGAFTLICKRLWPRVQITILEPNPATLPYLRHNVGDMNGVQILPFAASNFNGLKFLSTPKAEKMRGLWGRETFHGSPDSGVNVECRRLDDIIDDRVDIMKIDVEGHETQCLEGGMRILERHHPLIIVEVKKYLRGTRWDSRPILEETGYVFGGQIGQDFFYGWPQ